jgi:osmotically-inducible protein OsmY
MDEILWDPRILSSDIQATAVDGEVTLRGEVESYPERLAAEADAWRIAGVRVVNNNIEIVLDEKQLRDDEEIAAAARQALTLHLSVPHEQVQVSVADGWLTLGGELRWHYQKMAAEDAVSTIAGVRGVTNRIKIVPVRPSEPDVKERIEESFRRHADIDAAGIEVTIHGSVVTLRGKVHSRSERNAAITGAWSAAGVTQVNDHLTVEP